MSPIDCYAWMLMTPPWRTAARNGGRRHCPIAAGFGFMSSMSYKQTWAPTWIFWLVEAERLSLVTLISLNGNRIAEVGFCPLPQPAPIGHSDPRAAEPQHEAEKSLFSVGRDSKP